MRAAPIGVFDSGLGGLTVFDRLCAALPEQSFTYYADSAHAPYGDRPPGEIHDLTRAACAALFARGCRLVLLACNTAAAVALRRLQEEWVPTDRRVLGVFVPVIEAIAGRAWGSPAPPGLAAAGARRILLFATPATVASGAFQRELALRVRGVAVGAVPCPDLVPLIEAGDMTAAGAAAARYAMLGLRALPHPDIAVLGCTHYPLVGDAFAAALPPGPRILSQPDLVAAATRDYLCRHPRLAGKGPVTYLTTGVPAKVGAAAARMTGRRRAFEPA
ncbi:MAG: aspartate/glutamate racemase family protein [Pseudomonadota bacterium]